MLESDLLLEAQIKKKKRRILILLFLLLVALAAFPLTQLPVASPAAVAEEQVPGVLPSVAGPRDVEPIAGSKVAGSPASEESGRATPDAPPTIATRDGTPGDLGTATLEAQGGRLPDPPSTAVTGSGSPTEAATPAAEEPGSSGGGTGGTGGGTTGTPLVAATGSGTPGNLSTPAADEPATPPIVATGGGTPGTPSIVAAGSGTPGAVFTPTAEEQGSGGDATPVARSPQPAATLVPSPQPSATSLATATLPPPAELPVTGGSHGFGTGWLAMGLVALLVVAGVAALGRVGAKDRHYQQ